LVYRNVLRLQWKDAVARHWIRSTRVVLPGGAHDAPHVITPAQLAIEGSTISAVQRAHAPVDEPLEDLGDALVTPAFVNPHTHLSMACFRGLAVDDATEGNVVEDLFYAVESHVTDEDVRAFARLGCYESLLHGVGFVWEHYYAGAALADAFEDTGLSGCIAPTLQDVSGPGTGQLERQMDATLALHRDAAKRELGIVAALGPHATDTVSKALWTRIRDLAHSEGLAVHAHVAQSIEEFERSVQRHGVSCVGMLERVGMLSEDVASFLMVHAIYMTHEDLDRLAPERHALCFCPYSQLIFSFPAHVPAWEERGLPWVVATDAAASNDSMNVQKEMRFVAGLRDAALSSSPEYAAFLSSGTLEDAQAVSEARSALFAERRHWANEDFLLDRVWRIPGELNPDVTVGVLETGALANILVWDTEHPAMWPGTRPLRSLAMADTTSAIDRMMVAGRWISAHGEHQHACAKSDEVLEARKEASERFEALLARIGH